MAVNLSAPLDQDALSTDEQTMLAELQPNILKAHVRDRACLLFLRFDDRDDARSFLVALVSTMKSAQEHIDEVDAFKASGTPGTPYVGVGLTQAGYEVLEVSPTPADPSFRRGMKDPASQSLLNDPPPVEWDAHFQAQLHAVVVIGDADPDETAARRGQVLALLPASVVVVGEETGVGMHNGHGDGIEHFGYVDGRSQPLFLSSEIAAESATTDGINGWDPSTAIERVLVPDPAAPDPTKHFGSYFIFRKLEQNVRLFKEQEDLLATRLGLAGEDRERAGAMVVGRYEDGTPLTLQADAGTHSPVMNNFTYDGDLDGAKCPFHAHIRKTNPRGSGGFESPANERLHLMARRGQTYGIRTEDPNEESVPPAGRPSGGVGLLFMAFNADIGQQFDFTQNTWADNPGFPRVPLGAPAPGLDPVIGQGPRTVQSYPDDWGSSTLEQPAPPHPFKQAVTMKGGEYFFMPSLAFLRSMADEADEDL